MFSHDVHWLKAAVLGVGAIGGGLLGAWLLKWVDEKMLKMA